VASERRKPGAAHWLAVLALCGALPAAAGAQTLLGGTGCTDLRGRPINFGVDWQTQVKPIINEMFETGRCTSCHNPGQFDGDLDLTDIGIDAIYKLVPPGYAVPGQPLSSPLFNKVNCDLPGFGGARMPFFQNPLTIEEQELFYDWIAQGAQGDVSGEPAIPRDFVFRDGGESLRWY
jgi:hypothetical protein